MEGKRTRAMECSVQKLGRPQIDQVFSWKTHELRRKEDADKRRQKAVEGDKKGLAA